MSNHRQNIDEEMDKIYERLKCGPKSSYNPDIHCPLILKTMIHEGRLGAFLIKASIGESTFYDWLKANPLFAECYAMGKILAREAWEIEGQELRHETNPPGVISHKFEHWKMIGWSRFGVSKNGRIKLKLNPKDNPSNHYAQLLTQASDGDFTASEIKQLMEAINVGLNTHQVFQLQKEIDQLKSDLLTMAANTHGYNSSATQRIEKKD